MRRTLLRGGHVHAPGRPGASAMLVDGPVVAWVGTDDAADPGWADEVVDLGGALVTPAFVDAHVHLTATGLALTGLDLSGCASVSGVLEALAVHASGQPSGILLGHGWDETRWPERRPPTAEEVDRAAPGRAVYLSRVDAHSAVVSPALAAAVPGLAGKLEDPSDGRAGGLLTRHSHHAARRAALDAVTPAQRRAAQRAALHRAPEQGIGCVHECAGPDISGEDDVADLAAVAAAVPGPELVVYWGELGGVERARELGAAGAAGDLFADGSLGSHTAHLRAVYADGDGCGAGYLTAAAVRDHVTACAQAGVQAGFHAIGDAALDTVVTGFAEAAERLGPDRVRAGRHRVEHAEMLDADLISRFATLGLVASVQPAFDAAWGGSDGMYAQRLGAERAATLNPYAAMAAAGVRLAFGSDSPVTPLDPWGTVRAALRHRTPGHELALPAAFAAHTTGGHHAAGRDGTGTLAPGAPATYAVWECSGGLDPSGLPDLRAGTDLPTCRRTVVRGRTVYSSDMTREGTPA